MMIPWLLIWSFYVDYGFDYNDKWLNQLMVHNYDKNDTNYDYVHNNDNVYNLTGLQLVTTEDAIHWKFVFNSMKHKISWKFFLLNKVDLTLMMFASLLVDELRTNSLYSLLSKTPTPLELYSNGKYPDLKRLNNLQFQHWVSSKISKESYKVNAKGSKGMKIAMSMQP